MIVSLQRGVGAPLPVTDTEQSRKNTKKCKLSPKVNLQESEKSSTFAADSVNAHDWMNLHKLTIGEFSRLCRVTIKTIRHYEKIGLLSPEKVDRYSNYRYYTIGQMQRMLAIRQLKELGFSLEEIATLFNDTSHFPDARMLAEKIDETEQQIQALLHRQSRLQVLLDSRKHQEQMEKITIQSLPGCIVASYKGVIPSYNDLGRVCCEVIGPEMQRLGCECTEPGFCFTRELNKEYTPTDIAIEYCEAVKEARTDSALIQFYELAPVEKAICYKHYGPYDKLYESYCELFSYAQREGYEVLEAPRAVYVDGIWNQEDPSKWLTIIQLPVKQ